MNTETKITILESLNPKGYLYYNGIESRGWAIENEQWEERHEDAVEQLSIRECVTTQDIRNNYKEHYYIELISEAIDSEKG